KCAWLHGFEFSMTDQMSGVFSEWTMQTEKINLSKQLGKCYTGCICWTVWQRSNENFHAKSFSQFRHRMAQFTITDNAQCFSGQLDNWRIQQTKLAGFLPLALL